MLKSAIVLLAVFVGASARCPNDCSGHGSCGASDMCTCQRNFIGGDCSERVCPFGLSWVDTPQGDLDGDGRVERTITATVTAAFTHESRKIAVDNSDNSGFEFGCFGTPTTTTEKESFCIGLEVGDAIQVQGSASSNGRNNDGWFVVEQVYDCQAAGEDQGCTNTDSYIIVEDHRGATATSVGATTHRFHGETGLETLMTASASSVTITMLGHPVQWSNQLESEYYPHDAQEDEAHFYQECSNKGFCDRKSGQCDCLDGYGGVACERMTCPEDCSGHGTCQALADIVPWSNPYSLWDGTNVPKTYGCVCDSRWSGADCSSRECPKGDDPVTTGQIDEVQRVELDSANDVSGSFNLLFTDEFGEAWRTGDILARRYKSVTEDDCVFSYIDRTVTCSGATFNAVCRASWGGAAAGSVCGGSCAGAQTSAGTDDAPQPATKAACEATSGAAGTWTAGSSACSSQDLCEADGNVWDAGFEDMDYITITGTAAGTTQYPSNANDGEFRVHDPKSTNDRSESVTATTIIFEEGTSFVDFDESSDSTWAAYGTGNTGDLNSNDHSVTLTRTNGLETALLGIPNDVIEDLEVSASSNGNGIAYMVTFTANPGNLPEMWCDNTNLEGYLDSFDASAYMHQTQDSGDGHIAFTAPNTISSSDVSEVNFLNLDGSTASAGTMETDLFRDSDVLLVTGSRYNDGVYEIQSHPTAVTTTSVDTVQSVRNEDAGNDLITIYKLQCQVRTELKRVGGYDANYNDCADLAVSITTEAGSLSSEHTEYKIQSITLDGSNDPDPQCDLSVFDIGEQLTIECDGCGNDGKTVTVTNEDPQGAWLSVLPSGDSGNDDDGSSVVAAGTCDSDGACTVAASTPFFVTKYGDGTKEMDTCSGRGLCDGGSGVCACFKGYTLDDCSAQNALSM